MEARVATPEDAARISDLFCRFFDGSPLSYKTTYDPSSLLMSIDQARSNGSGEAFVIGEPVHGFAFVVLTPFYYSLGHTAAHLLTWYVDPESRGWKSGKDLHSAAEAWAKERGALYLVASCLDADHEKMSALYERMGHEESEHYFVKEL